MASWLKGQIPALRNPPETVVVENELVKSSLRSFGKSIFRIVFLVVFRKYDVTIARHFRLATLKL